MKCKMAIQACQTATGETRAWPGREFATFYQLGCRFLHCGRLAVLGISSICATVPRLLSGAPPCTFAWPDVPNKHLKNLSRRPACGSGMGAACILGLLAVLLACLPEASGGSFGRTSFTLRVQSRDRDWGRAADRRALLLRNTTFPLHGAVKEYG